MKLKLLFILIVGFGISFSQKIMNDNQSDYFNKHFTVINHGNIYDKPYGKLLGLVNKNDTLKIITKKGNWFHTEKGWIESSLLGVDPYNFLSYEPYANILEKKDIQNAIFEVIGVPENMSENQNELTYLYNNLFDQRFEKLVLIVCSDIKTISAQITLKQAVFGKKSIENLFQIPQTANLEDSGDYTVWKFGKNLSCSINCNKIDNTDKYQVVLLSITDPDKKRKAIVNKTMQNNQHSISLYFNTGPIEPWGDPGTGALFNMGMRIQGGAQLNIGNWVNLPLILKPLTAEVMVGYGMFNMKEDYTGVYVDGKTSVISVLALGRYDVTDLILNLIGFEYPALGIFGVAGLQYNTQSWDFPNWTREFDSVSSFGLNLGLGVKYNLQILVGKPVEIDLRFTQAVFIMGDVKDQDGTPMFSEDYIHTENGLLIGLSIPIE